MHTSEFQARRAQKAIERENARYGMRPITAAGKRRFANFLRTRSKNGKQPRTPSRAT